MKRILLILVVLAGLGGGGYYLYRYYASRPATIDRQAVHVVGSRDLLVSVTEGGTLEAVNKVTITNEVEGNSQIIFLTGEGQTVKKGDMLVELDSSDLADRLSQQQINYQNALSSHSRAEEDLQIQRSQNESNIRDAQLAVDFAVIDLDKYRDGDWPLERKKAQSDITLAEDELKRAQDRLTWTEQLQDQGYATRAELEADRLTVKRKELELEQAREKLRLLEKYDNPQKLAKLEAEVVRKREELERVKVRALSSLSQKQTDMESKLATLELNKAKLDRLVEQLDKTRIVAPQAGMVVYATSGSRWNPQPIAEGASVRQRQDLIVLPDTSLMKVEVKIHESRMNQVEPGQMAYVVIDSMPDRRFKGQVRRISVLPDSQSNWMNPDLKVYSTDIVIDDPLPTDIKPGLSARAEIIIDKLTGVIAVPLSTVTTLGDRQVVYRVTEAGTPEPVTIEIGAYNETYIHVRAGLAAGDRILLSPPTSERAPGVGTGVIQTEDVTAEDTKPRAPAASTDENAKPETEATGAADAQSLERILGRLPEDKRDAFRERWNAMSAAERRQIVQNMSKRNGGGGQPRSEAAHE